MFFIKNFFLKTKCRFIFFFLNFFEVLEVVSNVSNTLLFNVRSFFGELFFFFLDHFNVVETSFEPLRRG